MAVQTGTVFSFTDTANLGIDISDTLYSISPSDTPLLNLIGKDSLTTPAVATKHEWLEFSLRSLDGAIAASGTTLANVTDPVAFNVVAGQGVQIRANDILKIESELLRVTSVSTDAITVARGFGGSTAASHADSTAWAIVGSVDVQDAAVPTPRTQITANKFNYTQIFNDSVAVTSTAQAVKKYTRQDLLAALSGDAIKMMWVTMERTLIHSKKVAPSSGVSSAMDGLLAVISTNAYAKAGAALTEAHLKTALRDVWTAGGNPDSLVVVLNAFQKEQVNTFLDSQRMTTRTDTTGGSVIENYRSEYGTVRFLLDRNMPTDTVLILDTSRIGFGPLKDHALRAVPIPRTTAAKDTIQLWGQYTAEIRNENAHAKITGLSTS